MTQFFTQSIRNLTVHRLDSSSVQLFLVENFLSSHECAELISAINTEVSPSTVVGDRPDSHRTSQTAYLNFINPVLSTTIDQRISQVLGIDPSFSEPVQGQRYYAGEFYKGHYDWFDTEKDSGRLEIATGGQRTWTFMIYLNDVPEGGETYFARLGVMFTPIEGRAVCWRNLHSNGEVNFDTLHEARPVISGTKYVVTKWFREQVGRNERNS